MNLEKEQSLKRKGILLLFLSHSYPLLFEDILIFNNPFFLIPNENTEKRQ